MIAEQNLGNVLPTEQYLKVKRQVKRARFLSLCGSFLAVVGVGVILMGQTFTTQGIGSGVALLGIYLAFGARAWASETIQDYRLWERGGIEGRRRRSSDL